MSSIKTRIYRSYTFVSVALISIMITSVTMINEDLESTMLELDLHQEKQFLLEHLQANEFKSWNFPGVLAAYQPLSIPNFNKLPAIFHNLPCPFQDEVERSGKTYLVQIQPEKNGILFIGRDITKFEEREAAFHWILILLSILIFILSLAASKLISKRVISPLSYLSSQIANLPLGTRIPKIKEEFEDQELNSIALTINRFIGEIEKFILREQSQVLLASHELRTPLATITGALDVLEDRIPASKDLPALGRIRRASSEMHQNVETLLTLARRPDTKNSSICISDLLKEILQELQPALAAQERIALNTAPDAFLISEKGLLKILFRNVIQNALQHNEGQVVITFRDHQLSVADTGSRFVSWNSLNLDVPSNAGLGLYIVKNICSQCDWQIRTLPNQPTGTVLLIDFQ